jgi:N-acetylglucosaminyldiphosphoundecaprenol N-acetyl-beta-D-mannosaminyltransferase
MSTTKAGQKARKQVLGYPVDLVDKPEALSLVSAAWQKEKPLHVVTLNAEMVIAAQQQQELDRVIREAHLIIPDGSGVVFALRLNGHQSSRLPGIELAHAALELAVQEQKSIALIGGRPEVIALLKEQLESKYPGIKLVYTHDGYFGEAEEQEIFAQIKDSGAQLILAALGVPKQEFFIDRLQAAKIEAVLIGVGGSFDVWTGLTKRAPEGFQKLHLEWLYRLLSEPWRWKRMLSALPNFALQVIFDFIRKSGRKS